MAMLGQYRLRVKLNALDRKLAMAHAHDLAVVAFRRDLQARRHAATVDHQRMIAGGREWTDQSLEYTLASMLDRGHLAVHYATRANDAPSEGLADGLVTEAHAKNGNFTREALHHRDRNARFVGSARPRRNDDLLRLPSLDLFQRDRVVAMHVHLGAQLAQVLRQVVGERIVVVDQEQHGFSPPRPGPAEPCRRPAAARAAC